jgi:hypothetical protein
MALNLKILRPNYFFFDVAFFFVVFLVLGCFIPHDIILSPPLLFTY